MKKLILITALFIFSSGTTESDFCKGWKAGYKAGWCYERENGCNTPLIPLCPLPRYEETTYQHGYNRGFVKGKSDRK